MADALVTRDTTDTVPMPDNASMHEVESVWKLLDALGIRATPGLLKVFPDRAKMEQRRSQHDILTPPVLAMHISARDKSRQMSADKWCTYIRGVHNAFPQLSIAMFWSPGAENDPRHPGDDEKAREVLERCKDLGIIASPTSSLDDLMAGLASCDAFIGADGGALHVAVACGLPTVALFENSPFKRTHWYPWQIRHEITSSSSFAIGDINPLKPVHATQRLLSRPANLVGEHWAEPSPQ